MLLQVVTDLVAQAIPDPAPSAPAAFVAKWSTVLSLAKWISGGVAAVVLAGAGLLIFGESNGRGPGISPELKSKLTNVVIALVIVGSGAQIVQFLSA